MTRPYLIAKLILAATGVHLLVRFIGTGSSIIFRLNSQNHQGSFAISIIGSILLLAASLILLFRHDGLARVIAGPDAGQCEKVDVRWVIAAFRMTACFCGLLLTYSCIVRMFYNIPAIIKGPILSYTTLQGQTSQISPILLTGVLEGIVYLILAAYLISGAPHYVRWQISKLAINKSSQKEGVG
jgi:hypothetical protein